MATLNSRMLDFILSKMYYGETMDGRMELELKIDVGPTSSAPGDAHAAICKLMAEDRKRKKK